MKKKQQAFRPSRAQESFVEYLSRSNNLSSASIHVTALRLLLQQAEEQQLISPFTEADSERYFPTKKARRPLTYEYPEEDDLGLQAAEDDFTELWQES